MSSSSPDSMSIGRTMCGACVILAASLPVTPVLAAQVYSQPQVDVRAEVNDNWDLTPGVSQDSDVYGFIGDFQSLFGIATPRSDTSIRPRLVLQEYPDREDLDQVLAYLDLRSTYRWESSNIFVSAGFSREDLYNVEFPEAGFDPFDPLAPDVADGGRVLVGEVRTRFKISPTYTYQVSERTSIGATAYFDNSEYDTKAREDYDSLTLGGFYRWALDKRTDIGVDAYGSQFETKSGSSKTDGTGVGASFVRRLSESAGFEGRAFYESNDIDNFTPTRTKESTSGWGGNLTAYRNGPVSQWRFTAQQGFWPTGDGGKSEITQLRAQYGRDMSQRLRFRGALRLDRERTISSLDNENDRDYARLELSLRYALSPTWYVSGGYSYVWQEYTIDTDDADNNVLFLSVGYQGLGRQRR